MSIIYFLICLIASVLGAISGIGGGVIIKPVLDAIGTLNASTISFLSGCTVLSMTTMTLYRNRNSEVKVDKVVGTCLALGAAVGGLLGKAIYDTVKTMSGNPDMAGAIQSFVLAIVTVGVLIFTINKAKIKPFKVEGKVVSLIIGFLLGCLSSFLGIGGGPINLMILYLFFAMDTKTAALNSIYIIFFSQGTSVISTIVNSQIPNFEWAVFFMMIAGGLVGGTVGPMISKKLSLKGVDKIYIGMVIAIILISVYNGINYLGII
ncbi:MAG: sulfite exporter TauE/SafE family protein [Cellulosilyticaceae bacterium]